MRKRRGFKGTWFPVLSTVVGDPETPIASVVREAIVSPGDGFQVGVNVTSLILDVPQEVNNPDSPGFLGAFTQNGYALRRIVGKIYCSAEETLTDASTDTIPFAYIAAAGLFVARAADAADAGGGGGGYPIGGTAAWQTDYNPLDPNCIREPWIWRRTWKLGSPTGNLRQIGAWMDGSGGVNANRGGFYPTNNAQYGSAFDGPHVDARTRRRVSSDDRLFMAMAVHASPRTEQVYDGVADIRFTWEFRVFGAMRRDTNKGNF